MIRPLRRRHRRMILFVAIVTAVLLSAALRNRPPEPLGPVPPSLEAAR